jgi:hypothetical protein
MFFSPVVFAGDVDIPEDGVHACHVDSIDEALVTDSYLPTA